MFSSEFHYKIRLAALLAVLILNVSCKTAQKSDCGKEIVTTASGPCARRETPCPKPESARCRESKQRIAATLAATEKLKRQNPKPANLVVTKESPSSPSQVPKVGIPQSEIIPEETIAVGRKPVEKMVEVNEPAAIEKKPVETITVLDANPLAKPKNVEKMAGEKPAALETVPLVGNRAGQTPAAPADADKPPTTPILVEANSANQIIAADGREVEIKGSNCVIVVSGGCKALKLSGERNQVQCDSANYVNISGDHNTVVSGVLGKAVITGNRNIVSWGEGMDGSPPIADSTGQENEIERLE